MPEATGFVETRTVVFSAELSAVVGAGANALVGGSNITLQPLSVQVQTGVNAALGVSSMTLEPAH